MTGSSCDPDICDGTWHHCWRCGGEGSVEPRNSEDGELVDCEECEGEGGWPCPNPEPEVE